MFCKLPEVEGGGFVPVSGDNVRWSSWAGRQHGKQWAGLCAGQRGPKGLGGGGKALTNPVQWRLSAGQLPNPRGTDGDCQMLHNCCLTKNNMPVVVSQKMVCSLSPEAANAPEPALSTPACTSEAAGLAFQHNTWQIFLF